MRLQWKELAYLPRANPRYTEKKTNISCGISSTRVCLEGKIRVRYSTIRAVQFPVELHRVHTAGIEGCASGDSTQPVDGEGGAKWRRAASEKRVSHPVTDGPRQT